MNTYVLQSPLGFFVLEAETPEEVFVDWSCTNHKLKDIYKTWFVFSDDLLEYLKKNNFTTSERTNIATVFLVK